MKKELIQELFISVEDIKHEHDKIEYWSTRDLQALLVLRKMEEL